jgi:hypothetical protein
MDAKDTQLEVALRESETAIGDDGFSDAVMGGLPARRLSRVAARRLTLGGAALVGSVLTSVLGAPLETAFSSLVLEGGYGLSGIAAVAVIGLLAIPVAWVFYSR